MEGGRVRAARKSHSDYEKGLLIRIIESSHDGKYLKILNELSAKSNYEKSNVWLQITREFNRLVGKKLNKQHVRKLYCRIKTDKDKYVQACGQIGEEREVKQQTPCWNGKKESINGEILSDEDEHESFDSSKETKEQNKEDLVDCLKMKMDIKPPLNLPPIIFPSAPQDETWAQYYNEIVELQRKFFADQSKTSELQQAVLRSQLELQGLQKALDIKKLSSGQVKCKSAEEQLNTSDDDEIQESMSSEHFNDDTAEEIQDSFQSEQKLIKSKDYIGETVFQCNECDYKTFKPQKLAYHKTSKHSNVSFRCDHCEYTSNFKGRVKTHMQYKHGQIKFNCPECDYKATTKGALDIHIQGKHKTTTFYCDQCEFQSTWLGSITSHKRIVHEGVKYSCDQCDYIGSTKYKIIDHKKSKHEGAMYHCDQCQYTNSDQRNLVRHIRFVHQGITFDCDECDMKFSRKSHVTRHKESKHDKTHKLNSQSLPSVPVVTEFIPYIRNMYPGQTDALQESDELSD